MKVIVPIGSDSLYCNKLDEIIYALTIFKIIGWKVAENRDNAKDRTRDRTLSAVCLNFARGVFDVIDECQDEWEGEEVRDGTRWKMVESFLINGKKKWRYRGWL